MKIYCNDLYLMRVRAGTSLLRRLFEALGSCQQQAQEVGRSSDRQDAGSPEPDEPGEPAQPGAFRHQ